MHRARSRSALWLKLLLLLTLATALGCAQSAADEPVQAMTASAGSGATPPVANSASPSAQPASGDAGHAATSAPAPAAGNAPSSSPVIGSLPCEVATIVSARCQSCHAAQPRLGAPMPLVTFADFHRAAVSDPSHQVYELVARRIRDVNQPMPPASAGALASSELATFAAWVEEGAAASGATSCPGPVAMTPASSSGAAPGTGPAEATNAVCFDLTVHNESSAGDTSAFQIPTGESYHCFYFDAPWTAPAISVAFRSKLDNDRALHHWFLYAMPSAHPNGTVETCLPLHPDGPKMIAGWAPGGKDMTMPDGVGAELPAPGSSLMLEWHYFNNTDAVLSDKSSVSVCTVPAGARPNVAAITWVGTEDFGPLGMPPGMTSSFTGTCTPSWNGVGADGSVHALYTIPHMHQYGRHMTIEIARTGGSRDTMFDQAFSESNQAWVETPALLMKGDKLLTTCTFQNTSDGNVTYGSPFGNGEMCYGFLLAYPAHALDNGSASLLGASNACL